MASSENRPAFRLPWQSSHGSPSESDAAATAVVDQPAWPSHDLARRPSRADAGRKQTGTPTTDVAAGDAAATDVPADDTNATTATPDTTTHDDPAQAAMTVTADAPADTRSDMTDTATTAVRDTTTDLRSRKPTKFLVDLTRAMRQAADEARQSALAQFQAEVELHAGAARVTCEQAAADARLRADEDITRLGEWETAEIARVRRETEEGITARHGRLEAELADQTVRLNAELARVQRRVEAFETEMATFFEQLQHEDDPAHFASMAEQLPEPPAFEPWNATIDASAEPTALEMWTRTPNAADADALGTPDPSEGPELPAGDQASSPDAGMPPMLAGDFAAAEAEAAEWVATDEPVAAEAAAEPETAEVAPEAPQADASAADAPWPTATPAPSGRATAARTQVAVVGLVSVASIATFKRMLGRAQGVHAVQVSSGPDGEFLFNVTHDDGLDLPKAVNSVQGFEIEIVSSGPGLVSAHAVDPEVA